MKRLIIMSLAILGMVMTTSAQDNTSINDNTTIVVTSNVTVPNLEVVIANFTSPETRIVSYVDLKNPTLNKLVATTTNPMDAEVLSNSIGLLEKSVNDVGKYTFKFSNKATENEIVNKLKALENYNYKVNRVIYNS